MSQPHWKSCAAPPAPNKTEKYGTFFDGALMLVGSAKSAEFGEFLVIETRGGRYRNDPFATGSIFGHAVGSQLGAHAVEEFAAGVHAGGKAVT